MKASMHLPIKETDDIEFSTLEDGTHTLSIGALEGTRVHIYGDVKVMENMCEVLEKNLYDEPTYKELERICNIKELELEYAKTTIEQLRDRLEFLERR